MPCLFTTFPGRVKWASESEDALPILQEVREFASGPEELLEFALYTGGDFELVFTVDPKRLKKSTKYM
ncbi:hypothetical protein [Methanosarcina horonobensis]|uniref:hypothetical protein n=1 Tax=Methanosarcina horonobensis TaxID=418008 RepID=UPI000A5F1C51|nr:hypothetical protein [Methanosarcina horonobensis]